MNGVLPPNLRVPSEPNEPIDAESIEDLRELLEMIIGQNAEILERLNDEDYVKPITHTQNVNISSFAVFWEAAFSIWGLLIVVIICAMLTQIFSGTPLFK